MSMRLLTARVARQGLPWRQSARRAQQRAVIERVKEIRPRHRSVRSRPSATADEGRDGPANPYNEFSPAQRA